jgi:hypothetical protein
MVGNPSVRRVRDEPAGTVDRVKVSMCGKVLPFKYLRQPGVPDDGGEEPCNMEFAREANPKGDRATITMSGKFLPYKYYGAQQGVPEYGYKGE